MDITLLGSFRIRENDIDYSPTAPKQRQLLSLLVLQRGRVIPVDWCVEELWPAAPPRSAITTVHTYIMQLRKCLARIPSIKCPLDLLATIESGYQLTIPDHAIDLYRFRQKAAQARATFHEDSGGQDAVGHFASALAEWGGEILSDVRVGPLVEAQITRAQQERIMVVEEYVEVRLRLGLHRDLIHELAELVHEHSANENLIAQYMIALYRSGRQVEALGAYHRLRKTLDDELAIIPSVHLRELYQAILAQHPSLHLPAPRRSPTTSPQHPRAAAITPFPPPLTPGAIPEAARWEAT
jgi:DNA-binding SARP family transcriptional activator